jgi:hypothetical protein
VPFNLNKADGTQRQQNSTTINHQAPVIFYLVNSFYLGLDLGLAKNHFT